ncbi:exodeoxyribonuclease I [Photobacterium halotolerans]|uniref:exodeoxyribonuclease I n=1 Tax=Photobacterium halotolerans TaxID=265726 RepID=UPI0013734B30|nr:exodeoxyribonuclease I [Photobacterium halotolerans]NAW88764.1 exodeoxyribonuclease I [Photobacterium halotolerans]NAX49088.1 exodeoxyribonuclease I [Photobacterium halotolerans]
MSNNDNQPTLFWLDYETFGANPSVDRPCQFAGVRTDMDFNVIGEPLVIYCQPPSDYLPSPEACLITGITPQEAMEKGLPEHEFIARIHAELSKPNTCVVGYNNVRFDDEVTRYTLYRNFYDPYAWSWQSGNSRWDMLDIMRTCYALRPDGLNWPTNEDGFPSFKLEHLSVENGIEHSNAHDAMADVYATIELARKVKASQPKLFNYLFNLRHKRKLQELIDIAEMTPLVHVSGMFGSECGNTSWIVPMAWHPDNKNAVICVNLAMDPAPLFELDADSLRERLYTKRADLNPGELPVPLKLVHINKCPVLAPAKTLTAEDAERLGIDRAQCLANLSALKDKPQIREKLLAVFGQDREFEPNDDVDTQLYNGFFSAADKSAMDIIRASAPEELGKLDLNVDDKRIKPLLFRYRARNFPLTLSHQEQQQWKYHCQDYFETKLPAYMQNLESIAMEHQSDERKMKILKAVYDYVGRLV